MCWPSDSTTGYCVSWPDYALCYLCGYGFTNKLESIMLQSIVLEAYLDAKGGHIRIFLEPVQEPTYA